MLEVLWVDHLFLEHGIRQQRKQYFEYNVTKYKQLIIVNEDMSDCYVNGLPNAAISNKIIPNRIENHMTTELQKMTHPPYSFVKIEMNSYIGNPK